jgi:hypothetical protein
MDKLDLYICQCDCCWEEEYIHGILCVIEHSTLYPPFEITIWKW